MLSLGHVTFDQMSKLIIKRLQMESLGTRGTRYLLQMSYHEPAYFSSTRVVIKPLHSSHVFKLILPD